jgi:hypothetical protein
MMQSILDLPSQYNNIASATRASVLAEFTNIGCKCARSN